MNMIYFLIGCSIVLALIFLAAFFWASRTGQHDDTYTPSVRILFDDEIQNEDNHSGPIRSVDQKKEKSDEDHT